LAEEQLSETLKAGQRGGVSASGEKMAWRGGVAMAWLKSAVMAAYLWLSSICNCETGGCVKAINSGVSIISAAIKCKYGGAAQ